MRCATCGSELPSDARFCSRCGGKVVLGSVLGVGTDLPPVQRVAPEPVHAPPGDDPGTHGGFSAGRLAAMVATFVVLTIIGTYTLSQVFGPDAPEQPSGSAGSTAGPGTASAPPETPPEPSGSGSAGTAAAPTPSATLPDGARRCSRSGDDAVATAWSGNSDTSCAFTNAVREAYREARAPVHPTSFRTYSTVTKRWYDVTCGAGELLRCASADGAAVVFLGP